MANKNDKCTDKENSHEIKQNFSYLLMWKNLLFAFASYIRREKAWWQEEAEGFPCPQGGAVSLEVAIFCLAEKSHK